MTTLYLQNKTLNLEETKLFVINELVHEQTTKLKMDYLKNKEYGITVNGKVVIADLNKEDAELLCGTLLNEIDFNLVEEMIYDVIKTKTNSFVKSDFLKPADIQKVFTLIFSYYTEEAIIHSGNNYIQTDVLDYGMRFAVYKHGKDYVLECIDEGDSNNNSFEHYKTFTDLHLVFAHKLKELNE